jgi:hypothetical protein
MAILYIHHYPSRVTLLMTDSNYSLRILGIFESYREAEVEIYKKI